ADSFDEDEGRYRGLRAAQIVSLVDSNGPGLLVKPEVACKQMDAERVKPSEGGAPARPAGGDEGMAVPGTDADQTETSGSAPAAVRPQRFHGTVTLDAT